MKTKLYPALVILMLSCYSIHVFAQANKTLSNLISPTAVNVTLLPNQDNKRDLGSANKSWRNIYLDGSVYSKGIKFITDKIGTDSLSIAIGTGVLATNSSGYANTGIGYNALFTNTAGAGNAAVGTNALYANVNGGANTANGYDALYSNNVGSDNTAIGSFALLLSTTGNDNTGLGYTAGASLTTGQEDVFLGSFSDCGSTGHVTNSMALGFNTYVTSNNHVVIGDNAVTSIGGDVNWSNLSDRRVKKNIKQNVPGLEFINKLQPITYNLNLDAADKIIARPERKDKDGKIIQPSASELKARNEKQQIIYTGFIAQDVEKAAKELNYDFSGVDAAKNDHDLYGLRYAEFVVPLVKAVQELSSQNDELKKQNELQQKEIDELKNIVFSNNQQSTTNNQSMKFSSPTGGGPEGAVFLEQNIPNPFNHTTTINYLLPQQYSSAKIIITDKSGKVLKEINISGSRRGNLKVDASTLAGGAYQYSLFVDGKLISTKQMLLSH